MQMPGPSTLVLLAAVPLLAWRVYSRVRRLIGRQRLSRVRPWITLAIFPLFILLLGFFALPFPERLGWLAGALVAGALLGRYGLARTKFEPTPQGLYYTPNVHLGIALSTLFVARIVYRVVEVYTLEPGPARGWHGFATSSLTLAVFGLLAGYYISYAFGLVRWRRRVLASRER